MAAQHSPPGRCHPIPPFSLFPPSPSPFALQTQELWSFVIPAVWLGLLATPQQRARAAAPGNALPLAAFLLHYLNRDLASSIWGGGMFVS